MYVPLSIKNMTKQLVSTYNLIIKDSLEDILNGLKDDRLIAMTVIKEFGKIILSALFLLFFLLIFLFIRWIKHTVQKSVEKVESDADDIAYAFIRMET